MQKLYFCVRVDIVTKTCEWNVNFSKYHVAMKYNRDEENEVFHTHGTCTNCCLKALRYLQRSINVHTRYRGKCIWNDCVKKYLSRVFILTHSFIYICSRNIYIHTHTHIHTHTWIIADKKPRNFILLCLIQDSRRIIELY